MLKCNREPEEAVEYLALCLLSYESFLGFFFRAPIKIEVIDEAAGRERLIKNLL